MPPFQRLVGLAASPSWEGRWALALGGGLAARGARLLPILGPWPESPAALLDECGLTALIGGGPAVLCMRSPGDPSGFRTEALSDLDPNNLVRKILDDLPSLLPLATADRGSKTGASLALIGPMAVGKSSVGRALATRAGLPFVDLDAALEAELGMSISRIFTERGEPAFRELESQALASFLGDEAIVVATGGGIILDPGNRARIRKASQVVWLHAPVSLLAARAGGSQNRPLLSGQDPEKKLAAIYRERLPLYGETADFLLPVGRASPASLAEVIHDAIFTPPQPLR